MLPPFIIEQIRRREEEQVDEQPVLELPIPNRPPVRRHGDHPRGEEESADRGVVIIDLRSSSNGS